jgi:hypothetical protein
LIIRPSETEEFSSCYQNAEKELQVSYQFESQKDVGSQKKRTYGKHGRTCCSLMYLLPANTHDHLFFKPIFNKLGEA